MNSRENLKQWLKTYLKSRDAMQIVSIEEGKDILFVEYTTKKHLFMIHPLLEDEQQILTQLTSKEYPITLVTLNTKKNIVQLIKSWDILSQYPRLSIYFVVPSSNEKWVIFPFTHERIAERKNLEKGLWAIAAGIGYVHE